ncbi:uncharacterized protein [Eurosta solidaginis]|uniref:uncharacterized protein n=1 Tax=Eurosta solidaginis TaxID=178769 RepID=UPI003530DD73
MENIDNPEQAPSTKESSPYANGAFEHAPASEVGWIPPKIDPNTQLRNILELQSRQIFELVKSLQAPKSTGQAERISLPKYNPDVSGADPISWCSTVVMVIADNPLVGSALIIALSKSLEGCASHWLSQISYPGITWTQFKELFIQRFEGVKTSAATIVNILNGHPIEGECLSVYASRLDTSLMSEWKAMPVEEIVVSVILAHTSRFDAGLQRLIFRTNIKTRNELQLELRAFTFGKRKQHYFDNPLEIKNSKLMSNVKCHYCGKAGHKIAECRSKREGGKLLPKINQLSSGSSTEKCRTSLVCFRCGEVGHIASKCSKNSSQISSNSTNSYEKRVDICNVAEPKGVLHKLCENYLFIKIAEPKNEMQIVYTNNNKLKNILGSKKDTVPMLERSGIYQISCLGCDAKYVGQTRRQISVRFKEHEKHVNNKQIHRSAVAAHIHTTNDDSSTKHSIDTVEESLHLIKAVLNNRKLCGSYPPTCAFPIELHTDASADGYGAILMHKINNRSHVIEYFSKRTSSAESRYHSYELETLAVVNSIKHFRQIVTLLNLPAPN